MREKKREVGEEATPGGSSRAQCWLGGDSWEAFAGAIEIHRAGLRGVREEEDGLGRSSWEALAGAMEIYEAGVGAREQRMEKG